MKCCGKKEEGIEQTGVSKNLDPNWNQSYGGGDEVTR